MSAVDVDVHAVLAGGWHDLRPYISRGLAHQLEGRPEHFGRPRDTAPTALDPRGDPAYVRRHWLDRHGLDAAILISPASLDPIAAASVDESIELARARNDHLVDAWLPADQRFRFAVGVSPHDPLAAAEEVRRLSSHPAAVAVVLPLENTLLGHRRYHPVYEAAAVAQLPVIVHPGPHRGLQGETAFANGLPLTPPQRDALIAQIAMAHVVSLVFDGTFVLHPGLTVVFSGWGFSWLVHLLGRMDREWRSARSDAPWVTEPPSDLVRRHLRFTTHPREHPERLEDLATVARMAHAEDVLLFGSGFPEEGHDGPDDATAGLPPSVRAERAYATFGRLR